MEVEPTKPAQLATIIVTHQGRKGKGEVVGETIFRFNEAGIARVPYRGHVLNDVNAVIRASNGLASYHIEYPDVEVPASSESSPAELVTVKVEEVTKQAEVVDEHDDITAPLHYPVATIDSMNEVEELNEVGELSDQPIRKPVRPKKGKGEY